MYVQCTYYVQRAMTIQIHPLKSNSPSSMHYLFFFPLCSYIQNDPLPHIRDIFVQEAMLLEGGEFEEEIIDMDSITLERM